MPNVLDFDRISKKYTLGGFRGSLREAIPNLLRSIGGKESRHAAPTFWALKDLSFSVAAGEGLGIIGPNGAGKTTALKLATSVTQPTSGSITVRGRTSALIELGAGFHPDLTGQENIYLNGTILGMKRQEIRQRFDEIVAFSGLERFLDTPVKRYSSGMYARLGFAVAAHVNPDLLIVDEVLAVGDAAFQAKCLKRMADLKAGGTGVVFVTHNLGYLQRLCEHALLLYRGTMASYGSVAEVIQAYRDHPAYSMEDPDRISFTAEDSSSAEAPHTNGPVTIENVFFSDNNGARVTRISTGSSLAVHVAYRAAQPMKDASLQAWLYGLDGTEYASFSTAWDHDDPLVLDGMGELRLNIDPVCLMPGVYFVNVAIGDRPGLTKYDIHWERHRLTVVSGPTNYGVFFQPHTWRTDQEDG